MTTITTIRFFERMREANLFNLSKASGMIRVKLCCDWLIIPTQACFEITTCPHGRRILRHISDRLNARGQS